MSDYDGSDNDLPGYFVGIPIGEQEVGRAHVTILVREGSTPEDVVSIINDMKEELSEVLPLVIHIQPEVKMFGHNNDIPVHPVRFVHPEHEAILKQFYRKYYKQKPGHTPHPELEPHVSVDGKERKETVDFIFNQSNGVYIARSIQLKMIGDKEVKFQVEK